jgi:predicted transcriptional regulator
MAEQDPPPVIDPNQVADIVSSYVRHHQIAADQLTGLIVEVHRPLACLGPAPPVQEPAKPAVPIRRSVRQDYVVCLECGLHARTLRRHLRVRHGLEVAQYRARWNLSPDYPLTAPAYSDRRAVMAKAIGLGRRRSWAAGGLRLGRHPHPGDGDARAGGSRISNTGSRAGMATAHPCRAPVLYSYRNEAWRRERVRCNRSLNLRCTLCLFNHLAIHLVSILTCANEVTK